MKNIFGKAMLLATALLFSITGTSCSNDDNTTPEKEKTYDMEWLRQGRRCKLAHRDGEGWCEIL